MWYEFSQNNSGGSFVVDENVCHRLFIEANSAKEAEDKALGLGVYFDGCEIGLDCSCCGDRWYRLWGDDDIKLPTTHQNWRTKEKTEINSIEELAQVYADEYGWTKPDARIFYADGRVTEIFTQENK